MIFLRNLRKNIRYFEVFLVIIFEVSISPLRCNLLKTRFGVSFGFFFVGLGMFVRGGNASVVAVNIT